MFLYIKKYMFVFACFTLASSLFSQSSFENRSTKNQVKIPFDLVSNLIVIPVKLNGRRVILFVRYGGKRNYIV